MVPGHLQCVLVGMGQQLPRAGLSISTVSSKIYSAGGRWEALCLHPILLGFHLGHQLFSLSLLSYWGCVTLPFLIGPKLLF